MTNHPKQRKPSRWRWPRRITLILLAGVLLTIASSWFAQWRAFRVSATNARWVMDINGYYIIPTYHHVGDGKYKANWGPGTPDPPTPQSPVDIHHVPDLLWYIVDGRDRTYIHRNEWDHSRPTQRSLEPPGYPVIPHFKLSKPVYAHGAQLFDDIKPRMAIKPDDTADWFRSERYFDLNPGWFAASSFRRIRDQSLHALHRPVERWSAQRAGWPTHAMMTEQYAIGPRPPIERVQDMPLASLRHGLRGGLILHHQPQHPMLHPLGHHSLPLMPLWPGFAVNTAFYAASIATLWLTIGGSTHLLGTKKRRRKRGLCESCGYDIQGLETCPECGTQSTERDA